MEGPEVKLMCARHESWEFEFCAAYLVPPCSATVQSEVADRVTGSTVEVDSIPHEFFVPLFEAATRSCPIGIVFGPEGGEQRNAVRDLVRTIAHGAYAAKETAAMELACRLARATTKRSPIGLFVVLTGRFTELGRVALWKFPADEALQAQISDAGISINLLRDSFSRSSSYFKAAVFQGGPAETHFWEGQVEDRQAKQRVPEVADFWVVGFLTGRLAFTPVHGTRVLARALRQALTKAESAEDRDALMAAATVAKAQAGRRTSVAEFVGRYLPDHLADLVVGIAGGVEVADHMFELDATTLEKELKFRSLILDEFFTVKGPVDQFDDVVRIEELEETSQVEVSLRGHITSHKLASR